MSFSLNEIETMAKRAARGAGLAWGLAEEAGKAARWLASHGFPGPALLAAELDRLNGQAYGASAPIPGREPWQARGGRLSPLFAGAALADLARDIREGRKLWLNGTAHPLLIAPFAAAAAKLTSAPVSLSWQDLRLVLSPAGLLIEGPESTLTCTETEKLLCQTGTQQEPTRIGRSSHVNVDPEAWSRLSALAQRTYAPASEASRLAGAGAGLRDND